MVVFMLYVDSEIDLNTAGRDVLIGIIPWYIRGGFSQQQAIIDGLEKRVARLEGRAKDDTSRRMPGLKPKTGGKPARPKGPRKPRRHGFARTRMTPAHRVEHALEQCPDCGTRLSGGWTQRTREVSDLPEVPVKVAQHAYIVRTCPMCQRCRAPTVELDGVVLGRQRLGRPSSAPGGHRSSTPSPPAANCSPPLNSEQLPPMGKPPEARCTQVCTPFAKVISHHIQCREEGVRIHHSQPLS